MEQIFPMHSDYREKAQIYCRYRWPYALEAGDLLAQHIALTALSTVADVGCGTGMVLPLLSGRAGHICGIEPDEGMRRIAAQIYEHLPGFELRNATAEATTLADCSVDLITVGRALHWFSMQEARAEFRRILRPGGWLATLQADCISEELLLGERQLRVSAYGFDEGRRKALRPVVGIADYLAHSDWREIRVITYQKEGFEEFFGRQQTYSGAPRRDNPLFPAFAQSARTLFHVLAPGGTLNIPVCTTILVGQMKEPKGGI